ncbi:MAG: class I SAM-dependent methyltransferase [Planctomycetaceae bacterium]
MTVSPTPPLPPAPPQKKRGAESLRRLIESDGIRRLTVNQYKNHIRNLYDGPRGAVLTMASMLSLHEPLVGRMIRTGRFDVTKFQSVLDIGAGAGQILKHLLKFCPQDAQIVACDLSHQMLRRARKRIKSDRPAYVAADMTHLPFADDSFDCVTCGWVIEHLPDPVPGLTEMGRVLKPGGSLFLLATEDTYSGAMTSRTWKCRTYNRAELRSACEESGLPWHDELWFTPLHRFLRLGGIFIEARKPVANDAVRLPVEVPVEQAVPPVV